MVSKRYSVTAGFVMLGAVVMYDGCNSAPKPSSSKTTPSQSDSIAAVQDVSFCALIETPERFDNKIVRTEAVFYADRENSALYSPDCPDRTNYVWTDFDTSF